MNDPTAEVPPTGREDLLSTRPSTSSSTSVREELLEALHEAVGGPVPIIVWAAAHMGDIEKLQLMLGIARLDPTYLHTTMAFHTKLPLYWKQRKRSTPSSVVSGSASSPALSSTMPYPTGSSVPVTPTNFSSSTRSSHASPASRSRKRKFQGVSRDPNVTDACKLRDGNRCALTGMPEPDGAHIFPFCHLRVPPRQGALWESLRMFWTDATINAWVSSIFPNQDQGGIEHCANLISMSQLAHKFWGNCWFALRPLRISDDQQRLELEFVWLKQQNYSNWIDVRTKPDLILQGNKGHQIAMLLDGRTERILQTGDIIVMTTDDPVARPLPSIPLLQMQWVLNQFCSMCAGAEPIDLEAGIDNDDDECFALPAEYEDDLDSLPSLDFACSSSEANGPDSSPCPPRVYDKTHVGAAEKAPTDAGFSKGEGIIKSSNDFMVYAK